MIHSAGAINRAAGGNAQAYRGRTTSGEPITTAEPRLLPSATADFGLVVGDGGSLLDQPVQDNNPWGWACGLKKLGGHFTTSAWNDGVWFEYNNGISMWELNGVNGKQATTYCVK